MSKGLIVDVFAEAGLLWSVHQSNCHAVLELGQYLSDRLGLHLVHLGKDSEEHADMQKQVTAVPRSVRRSETTAVVASRNEQHEAAGRSRR